MSDAPETPGADDRFQRKLDHTPATSWHNAARWGGFEAPFGRFYKTIDRPALPFRLMVGPCDLKLAFALSDEQLMALWTRACSTFAGSRIAGIGRPVTGPRWCAVGSASDRTAW